MQNARLADAWGEWLGSFDWDAWCTLTFREPYSADAADRAFRRWAQWIEKENPRFGYFVGHELGGIGGRLHLHALLGGLEEGCSRRALWKRWHDKHGRAQLLPYDREKGAAFYVSKYVTKEIGHYDIQPARPICTQEQTRLL